MDFFESQDIARRNTKLLLFLFFLAVVSLILLTNGLVFVFINMQDSVRLHTGQYYFSWDIFGAISVGVVSLVVIASFIRLTMLRKGGSTIAELMDGELLVSDGGDLKKRQLLNVVEEMAIASGTPVPPVYLIRESGINAFAAGYSPGDAVIGITEGAMQNLNRDQLQGVIAHEFSHILNGDMRLNIRLMGILYGILMMALVGRMLVSPGRRLAGGRNKGHAAVLAMGAGLMLIGYLGQFFGNLIKAAVSRQREFLADASAVQFTRNPQGIANALKRIGGYHAGSKLTHPETAELSHTFFCEAITFSFRGMMATHPPLAERIKRIEPRWQGEYIETQQDDAPDTAATSQTPGAAAGIMGFAAADSIAIDPEQVLGTIGNPAPSQVALARDMIDALPAIYTTAARDPYSARALIYLLQLSPAGEARNTQLEHLKVAADFGVYDALSSLLAHETLLKPGMKLPLLEITYPSLRQLSYEQYKLFMTNMDSLIRADGKVGLSEWAVQTMIRKHLGAVFESRHTVTRYNRLSEVRESCETLLSLLAHCDRETAIDPSIAFDKGAAQLEIDISLLPTSSLSFKKMNHALEQLAALHPLKKPKLIKACVRTVTADEKVSHIEAELLRTIADCLECPMPPIGLNS